MSRSRRTHVVARVLGGIAATVALFGYGVLLLLVPDVLDRAFDEGGNAMKLVVVVGAAMTVGVYLAVERLAARALAR